VEQAGEFTCSSPHAGPPKLISAVRTSSSMIIFIPSVTYIQPGKKRRRTSPFEMGIYYIHLGPIQCSRVQSISHLALFFSIFFFIYRHSEGPKIRVATPYKLCASEAKVQGFQRKKKKGKG